MGDYIQEKETNMPSALFHCTRLNATTFRIVEDDKYREQPFIYAKLVRGALILIDTGCGGATNDTNIELTSLKDFIETYPVDDNDGEPLNEDGRRDYIVICSHCHYDHILGIEPFAKDPKTRVWASSYDKSFLEKDELPKHSLCKYLNIPMPEYNITDWAGDGVALTHHGKDVGGMVTYHTPGHTPDELAIFDKEVRVLYVGDTLYEWAPIIFPREGNLFTYSESMGKLRRLVKEWNAELNDEGKVKKKVTIACGHCTHDADAAELLAEVDGFLLDVVDGKVKVSKEENGRGGLRQLFERSDGRLSFLMPKTILEEFRADDEARLALRRRVEK